MRAMVMAVVLAGAFLCGGCTQYNGPVDYLADRYHDMMDMTDLGLIFTTEATPQGFLYIDFFNLTPLGWADIEGYALGIGNRNIGWYNYRADMWGYGAYGEETYGFGKFNSQDMRQARADQRELTERPLFHVGFAGIKDWDYRPPRPQYVECNRILHLGWIGFYNQMRPVDILDFPAGIFGFDLVGDDVLNDTAATQETPETTGENPEATETDTPVVGEESA